VKPAWAEQFEEGSLRPAPRPRAGGSANIGVGLARRDGRRCQGRHVDTRIEEDTPWWVGSRVPSPSSTTSTPRAACGSSRGPREDLFGRGTACAAIIRSLAPECELYGVRVLGERMTGKGQVFAAGLRWSIDQG
jgi:subtilisin